MRVADLVFEPRAELGRYWMERAEIRLDNGVLVSVVQGPLVWLDWHPGLFEAAVIEPGGLLDDTITRGDAAVIEAWLARLARVARVDGTEKGPAS